jgi:hypothetical protein
MYPLKQSTAITVPVFCHDANGDAVTGLSDGSFTKRISKAGGAFGAMSVTISEMENGWYALPLSTSHTDTVGVLTVTLTNAGCKQVNLQFRVGTGVFDDILSVLGSPVGASIAADIAATPTLTELQAEIDDVQTDIAGLNDPTAAEIRTEIDANSTQLAAIKGKTDNLTFTQAGHVDANMQRLNDVLLAGSGVLGDEWGP